MIYLGLGSNLGEREKLLQHAIDELSKTVDIKQISPVYETPPWGEENQPAFLNVCVAAETNLSAEALFNKVKEIEAAVGRTESYRWGPREIDIDILFFDDEIIKSQRLTIPHPRLQERAFVLKPLADIAPDFIHPELSQTVSQLLKQVDTNGVKKVELDLQSSI